MAQANRLQLLSQSDIIILLFTCCSWLVSFHISSQLAAQHSNTRLVLAVAACFRNPPPSPAPPVRICNGVISCMLYVQQEYFLHAHSSRSVDVLAVASLSTKIKHINIVLPSYTLRVVMTEITENCRLLRKNEEISRVSYTHKEKKQSAEVIVHCTGRYP